MNTTEVSRKIYLVNQIERDDLKKAIKVCKSMFTKVTWENITIVAPSQTLYAKKSKEAAIREARITNSPRYLFIRYVLETEFY